MSVQQLRSIWIDFMTYYTCVSDYALVNDLELIEAQRLLRQARNAYVVVYLT